MVGLRWSFRDNTSPHVSRTLLSILTDLNNDVIWMVSILPPMPNSSSSFSKPLGSVQSAPSTIDIILTLIFHSFFSSLARSKYLSTFFTFFIFLYDSLKRQNLLDSKFSSFFFITSQCVFERIKIYVCIWKPRECYAPLFLKRILVCAYNIC